MEAGPTVEIDILAPSGYERRGEGYHGIDHYCVTFRLRAVTDVVIADFLSFNEIGELKLRLVDPAHPTTSRVQVALEPIAGCGAELALECGEMEVVSVIERRSNDR